MDLASYLEEQPYIDYSNQAIQDCMRRLFKGITAKEEKARIAYHFVRDAIPHAFDCNAWMITAKASDVLRHQTGICHAKANLLVALLRPQGIPAGFCFQRITLADDDSMGYCVHAYNSVYLRGRWVKLDARGNKEGIEAKFSLDAPALAYPRCRPQYDECFYEGIYPHPHKAVMAMLEECRSLQDILDNIPDTMEDYE